MSIRMSNRQYPLVQAFLGLQRTEYMSIEQAQKFDQRPFRSMLIREWIAYRPGRGFHLTREGREAWHDFHATDISRRHPELPLTSYFDPTQYGLKPPAKGGPKRRLQEVA